VNNLGKTLLLLFVAIVSSELCATTKNHKATLQYKNAGVNFYTTKEIYSKAWQLSLDLALEKYQQLISTPHPIDVYLLEDTFQAILLRNSASDKPQLVLSLDILESKKKGDSTSYSVINHELCHLWFIETLKSKGLNQTKDPTGAPTYGHSNAEDWIDESVAIHCETGPNKSSKLTQHFTPIPLSQFLDMENPAFALVKEHIVSQLKANQDKQIVIKKEFNDESLYVFYQQAYWFREFLLATLGELTYQEIAETLVKQGNVNQYLLSQLGHRDWLETDRAFKNFIVNRQSTLTANVSL